MSLPYEFSIALRYLRGYRREFFLSFITWLCVGGVALGVTTLIVVLSVMTGFEEELRNRILGMNAHVVVYPMGGRGGEHEDWVRAIESLAGVQDVAPFVYGQVMLMSGAEARGAVLKGVDVGREERRIGLDRLLVEGGLESLEGDVPGLLVGRELARGLRLAPGDRVQVVSPEGTATPFGFLPRLRTFRVAGIVASGMYDLDSSLLFVALETAQDFLRLGRGVTGIEVRVEDIYAARRLAREIEARLGPGAWARDWMEMNRNLFSSLKLQKAVMGVILALVVLVAAFNVASTLIMVVLKKAHAIGVLKSMGSTNRSIRRIFVMKGLAIGCLGSVIGILLAWVLCASLRRYPLIKLSGEIYYLDRLPVAINPNVFVLVALGTVGLCYLATVYPSWRASRFDPVVILRAR